MTAPLMADHAVDYAARGWPVFPLHWATSYGTKKGDGRAECSCRKGDCDNQGKHPRTPNGLSDASTDPAIVEAWWRRWPEANIGLTTGHLFDAIDFDSDKAIEAFNERFDGYPPVDRGPMSLTGRGVHCLTQPAAPSPRRKTVGSKLAGIDGLDYRGLGGYIVAPPSIHYSGTCYRWVDGRGPDAPIVDLPALWLLDAAAAAPSAPGAAVRFDKVLNGPQRSRDGRSWVATLEGLCRRVAGTPEGERNQVFSWAIWKILHDHAPARMPNIGAAVDAVREAGRRAGLTDSEMEACVKTAARKTGVAA